MDDTVAHIQLPDSLTQAHAQAITRYLADRFRLAGGEWLALLEGMDILRQAIVTTNEQRFTFAGLYRRLVEDVYADSFIAACYNLTDVVSESEPLRASIARRIVSTLRERGLYSHRVPQSQFLAAFIVYWWESFARGYAFEIDVFRDLAASGVHFTAHALGSRHERLSAFDLSVLGFRGDIKTSTYFLHMRRTTPTTLDFYITRLYHHTDRRWERMVLLGEDFWQVLDGEPQHVATLGEAWQVLPAAALLRLRHHRWVVVLYDWWKQRVLKVQA